MRGALHERRATLEVPDVADGLVGAERVECVAQSVERAVDAGAVTLDELLGIDRDVPARAPAAVGHDDQVLLLQSGEDLVDFRARNPRAAGDLVARRRVPLHEGEVEPGFVLAEADLAQAVDEGGHGQFTTVVVNKEQPGGRRAPRRAVAWRASLW